MTPFGKRIRQMRKERGILLKDMAADIGVSSAYLSALEHGRRSRPSWVLIQRIITFFNVIWDEAEALQRLAAISHPRVTIDTAGMPPEATEFANLLAENIGKLSKDQINEMFAILERDSSKLG